MRPPSIPVTDPPRPRSTAARAARLVAAAAVLLGSAAGAPAETVEQRVAVQVVIHPRGAAVVRQDIAVTIVREAGSGRRPFLILHHGRGTTPAERAAMGLQTYPANARYFAERGFVVIIPTRVGYGISGGPDVEETGGCAFKRFADGVDVAVAETRQVVAYARQLPYVDAGRGIVVGESFGGLVAIAVASGDIPGVVAAISISGGDGGDSVRHVDEPCRPDQLRDTFARYGTANRLPTLWMYSANDRFWGPVYPRQWYEAFRRAGGRGQFVELPADKNNGHFIFNRNALAWQPSFERFLAELQLSGGER
jgi:dienelactone hydrolase